MIHILIHTLDIACTSPLTSLREPLLSYFKSAFITKVAVYWRGFDDSHSYPRLIACTITHAPCGAFLFDTCMSLSLSRMQRYTQLSYLFRQCGTSFLRRDSFIAECTVRHPGVERQFSSLKLGFKLLDVFEQFWTQSFSRKECTSLSLENPERNI